MEERKLYNPHDLFTAADMWSIIIEWVNVFPSLPSKYNTNNYLSLFCGLSDRPFDNFYYVLKGEVIPSWLEAKYPRRVKNVAEWYKMWNSSTHTCQRRNLVL